jgi:mono/diheme cytochrome c family protein
MKMGTRLALTFVLVLSGQVLFAQETTQSLWIASPLPTQDKPKGYAQFQNYCFECHGDGAGKPGTAALKVKYNDELDPLLEKRKDLTPDLVKYFIRHGVGVMAAIRKTEISDDDMDLIAAFLSRDLKSIERATADVHAGKAPSRISRDLPLVFSPLAPVPPDPNAASERLSETQTKGKTLFEKTCVYCHRAGGFGTQTLARRIKELNEQFDSLPPEAKAAAGTAKRMGADQAELVKRDNLAPDYVSCVVRHGVKNMPASPPLDFSDSEVDLLAAYLTRNNLTAIAPVARGADCQPLEK